jgi:hypothetical protein
MRLRIILLVIATSSLVLVSFLLPLAIVLRAQAADRAVSAATIQAQGMTRLVATLRTSSLRLAVDQMNAENASTPITVFLPGRRELGVTAPRSKAIRLAAKGRSITVAMPTGVEILIAVEGLPAGTAVIRTFVPESQLRRGVTRAWLLLGASGSDCSRSAWPLPTSSPGPWCAHWPRWRVFPTGLARGTCPPEPR